jgi:hypothetical protein
MTIGPIQLRDKVLRNIAFQGEPGASWLEALPSLLGRLEAEWSINAGSPFPNATEAFVSEAATADGQPAALKIPIPGLVKAERERSLLQTASGCGYVRVLRHDRNSGAMLLERLGPQLAMPGFQSKNRSGSSAGHCSRPGCRYRPARDTRLVPRRLWKCHHTFQRPG